jgi:hypothetical protein
MIKRKVHFLLVGLAFVVGGVLGVLTSVVLIEQALRHMAPFDVVNFLDPIWVVGVGIFSAVWSAHRTQEMLRHL